VSRVPKFKSCVFQLLRSVKLEDTVKPNLSYFQHL